MVNPLLGVKVGDEGGMGKHKIYQTPLQQSKATLQATALVWPLTGTPMEYMA